MPDFSPDTKRKIVALTSVLLLLVISAFFLFGRKEDKTDLMRVNAEHYDIIKDYMQSEYTAAYADYFDVMYVEELENYVESASADGKNLEVTFLMKAYYRYPYRDPDTVPKVIEARESGDMKEYKRLYDGYNQIHNADYLLKIVAETDGQTLTDVTLYSGDEKGNWVLLENGLKDYITEEK